MKGLHIIQLLAAFMVVISSFAWNMNLKHRTFAVIWFTANLIYVIAMWGIEL